MWKATKGKSMIACPYSSKNALTIENNMITSESIDS